MAVDELGLLRKWAENRASDPQEPAEERPLWSRIAREIAAYQAGDPEEAEPPTQVESLFDQEAGR